MRQPAKTERKEVTSTGGAGVVVMATAKRGPPMVAGHTRYHEGEDRACSRAQKTAWPRELFQRLGQNQDESVFVDLHKR